MHRTTLRITTTAHLRTITRTQARTTARTVARTTARTQARTIARIQLQKIHQRILRIHQAKTAISSIKQELAE